MMEGKNLINSNVILVQVVETSEKVLHMCKGFVFLSINGNILNTERF